MGSRHADGGCNKKVGALGEREKDEEEDQEHEANLEEALADKTKAVKLVVDKWFVDRGFGFGKALTGEIVFIHASVVLMVGTDAWAQVVSDHARAEGVYRAQRAWGRNAWRQERDKEKANRVAQHVRRAAALTAEFAAQSEKKTAAVCDQPPGLDELAEDIGARNMGAGGSHPQATMMQGESVAPAATSHPFATPAVGSLLPSTQIGQKGAGRGARSWSVARGQEAAAWVEETVGFYVKATGKDETQIRQRLAERKPEEVRRSREHWRLRAEEKQCFQEEEAWEVFRRQPGHKQTTKEKFAQEFKRRVTSMVDGPVGSKAREKYGAQSEERRREARERIRTEQEASNSQRQRSWEKTRGLRITVPSPLLVPGN